MAVEAARHPLWLDRFEVIGCTHACVAAIADVHALCVACQKRHVRVVRKADISPRRRGELPC